MSRLLFIEWGNCEIDSKNSFALLCILEKGNMRPSRLEYKYEME